MSWLAVNPNGDEKKFEKKPIKFKLQEVINNKLTTLCEYWRIPSISEDEKHILETGWCLTEGTIKKLIGKELTWEDEPYEYN